MDSQRIKFILEEDPLKTVQSNTKRHHKLSLTDSVSASSLAAATFQLPRFFSRVVYNWAARGSLLETFTRFVLYFYRGISGFWSYFAVIVLMRKSILERR